MTINRGASAAAQLALCISRLPAAPAARSRSRPSGRTSSGSGVTRSTRCARTSRAFRPPWPTRSSAATRDRGDVVLDPFSGRGTTPLQACAEGRIGVGNDLNPLRPPPDRGQGRAGDPAPRPRPGWRTLRLGWAARRADWLALARTVVADAGDRRRVSSRRPGAASAARDETVPAEVAVAFHARTLGQLLYVRIVAPPRRPDRPLPGARR